MSEIHNPMKKLRMSLGDYFSGAVASLKVAFITCLFLPAYIISATVVLFLMKQIVETSQRLGSIPGQASSLIFVCSSYFA